MWGEHDLLSTQNQDLFYLILQVQTWNYTHDVLCVWGFNWSCKLERSSFPAREPTSIIQPSVISVPELRHLSKGCLANLSPEEIQNPLADVASWSCHIVIRNLWLLGQCFTPSLLCPLFLQIIVQCCQCPIVYMLAKYCKNASARFHNVSYPITNRFFTVVHSFSQSRPFIFDGGRRIGF